MKPYEDLKHSRLDVLGLAACAVCVGHCLSAPLLPGWLAGGAMHWLTAALALATATASSLHGFCRHHEWRVWNWFAPGAALLLLARLGGETELGESGEILATVLGGSTLAVAHRLNSSLAYWFDKH